MSGLAVQWMGPEYTKAIQQAFGAEKAKYLTESGDNFKILLTNDACPVGFVGGILIPDPYSEQKLLRLHHFFLLPPYRQQIFGEILLYACEEAAQAYKAKLIFYMKDLASAGSIFLEHGLETNLRFSAPLLTGSGDKQGIYPICIPQLPLPTDKRIRFAIEKDLPTYAAMEKRTDLALKFTDGPLSLEVYTRCFDNKETSTGDAFLFTSPSDPDASPHAFAYVIRDSNNFYIQKLLISKPKHTSAFLRNLRGILNTKRHVGDRDMLHIGPVPVTDSRTQDILTRNGFRFSDYSVERPTPSSSAAVSATSSQPGRSPRPSAEQPPAERLSL